MEIKEIANKNIWEDFLAKCEEKTFMQSWSWGEFSKMMGEKIWRFGFYEGNTFCAAALVIKKVAKRGIFLLVPHGPVVNSQLTTYSSQLIEILLQRLEAIAQREKASFIRISPLWERGAEHAAIFKKAGFRQAPLAMHPESSWKLDVASNEEDLLRNMRKTTRYLIRQAFGDKDIHISQSKTVDDIKLFSDLHQQVSERQRFVPFSFEYLKNEFLAFGQDDQAALFFGRYRGEIAAACFVIFWSRIAFYHHAVSLPLYAKYPVPYLLQWTAMREAKRRGCALYDFWGYTDPQKYPKHPWAGPTLFKMGFGGKAYEYVKTQDFPLHWSYWTTFLFETFRRFRRHL